MGTGEDGINRMVLEVTVTFWTSNVSVRPELVKIKVLIQHLKSNLKSTSGNKVWCKLCGIQLYSIKNEALIR